MSGKFTLTIDLGNAAMSTPADVGRALEEVAAGLVTSTWDGIERGGIRDGNGNTVGSWDVEDPPEQEHEWEVTLVLDDDTYFDAITVYATSREAACEREEVTNRVRSAAALDGQELTIESVRQLD